ncbi:MAG: hypothetical protein U1E39_17330 [Planctomycetota bacterium]
MEGAPRPPRRRLGRWRRRAAAWAPQRTNEAQFARDRAYLDEDALPFFDEFPRHTRARFLFALLTMAAVAIAVIVLTFRWFPPVVGLLLTLSASALVLWWSRAHRAETPLHLARHVARHRAASTGAAVRAPATPRP